jgi:hypothetical protein
MPDTRHHARVLLLATFLIAIARPLPAVPLLRSDYLGFPVGSRPRDLVAGDLTGDRVDDLVVADNAGVACLAARGDGDFAPLVRVDTLHVSAIAIAELTGDRIADLAVAARDVAELRVYPGRGDGTFDSPMILPFRRASPGLLARDLDGDGRADLVGSDPGSGSIWTWFARRGGEFTPPVITPCGNPPGPILSGDLDGDGATDLFVLHQNSQAGFTLMHNDGRGGFGPPVLYAGPSGSSRGTSGDFDGDGAPDVAIPEGYAYPLDPAVNVWRGRRDGTFASRVRVRTAQLPYGLAACDLDQDGHDELIIGGTEAWTIHPGGPGGVGANYTTQYAPHAGVPFVPGRFDADGRTDLACIEWTADGGAPECPVYKASTVFTFRGDGAGGFETAPGLALDERPAEIDTLDFDHDGRMDLVVAARSPGTSIWMLHGRGDGTFVAALAATATADVVALLSVDVDEDGRSEVVVATGFGPAPAQLSVYDVDESGGMRPRVARAIGSATMAMGIADFDGDGRVDFALANYSLPSRVQFLLAGPDRSWSTNRFLPLPMYPQSLAVYDLDRDGRPDVVVGATDRYGRDGHILEYRGDSDTTFAFVDSVSCGLVPMSIVVNDRGPARDPQVIAAVGLQGCMDEHSGALVLNVVEGVFARTQGPLFLGGGRPVVHLADLTGDGLADLVASAGLGRVDVLPGRPDGTFDARMEFGVSSWNADLAIADFDGDGRLDVVCEREEGLVFLANRGGAFPPEPGVVARLGGGAGDAILAWGSRRAIPLVIAGSPTVDPRAIDPASVRLAGAMPIPGRERLDDGVARTPVPLDPCAALTDGPDGAVDLSVVFRADEVLDGWMRLRAAGGVREREADAIPARLPFTARLIAGGTMISGEVCVLIVGRPTDQRAASTAGLQSFGVAPSFESGVGVMLELPVPAARADVSVYDVAGRRVATLHRGALDAGVHRLTWSGPGASGSGPRPGAGIYFVRALIDGQGLRTRILVAR